MAKICFRFTNILVEMATYSIKHLSILSGVKTHTIRIWEKRYKLFSPNRTNTNIRRYSDDDLKLALNVSHLQAMGYKISKIANFTPAEIVEIITQGDSNTPTPILPESLLAAAINMEYEQFLGSINASISRTGFDWTYEHLIIPFQKRMGELWLSGGILPAQEHFATNAIRELIISHSQGLPIPPKSSPKVLFFLPEHELHEIGLLYSAFISRSLGFRNIYLGQSVPANDILALGKLHNVNIFVTSIIAKSLPERELTAFFEQLTSYFPHATIIATGHQVEVNAPLLPRQIIKSWAPQHFKGLLMTLKESN